MNLDKEGKLDIPSRWTFRIMNEFEFNLENMADAIIDLRTESENKDKRIAELEEELQAIRDGSQ